MRKSIVLLFVTASLLGSHSCRKPSVQEEEKKTVFPEAVDLGLSVKWASLNVGARTPQEYGYYVSWGETAPKDVAYTPETYQLGGGKFGQVTKYLGAEDNKYRLELEDDIAYKEYGRLWRTPTRAELEELLDASFLLRRVVKEEGVWGVRITSLKTGNSIFLPAAGRKEGHLIGVDHEGFYWSSEVTSWGYPANLLRISVSLDRDQDVLLMMHLPRHVGASVRAVQ